MGLIANLFAGRMADTIAETFSGVAPETAFFAGVAYTLVLFLEVEIIQRVLDFFLKGVKWLARKVWCLVRSRTHSRKTDTAE